MENFPDFNQKKEQYLEVSKREEHLNKELEKIKSDQQIYMNRISEIEGETELINDLISKSKTEDGTINESELQQKCKETIDQFLHDVNLDEQFSLPIIIEYEQMKIFKNLNDQTMTFGKLKEETQMQFGKEANEFFFSDINGNIFSDELKVIPALFPLSNVKVDKYQSVIKVIDKSPIKKIQDTNAKKRLEEMDKLEDIDIEQKKTSLLGYREYTIIISGLLVVFLGIWCQGCINYMNQDDYKLYNTTYRSTINPLFSQDIVHVDNVSDYLNDVTHKFASIYY